MFTPVVIAWLISFGSFTWLALYLALRVTQQNALVLTSLLALSTLAVFFGSNALKYTTYDQELYILLQRGTLWSAFLPVAAWFHFSFLLHQQLRPTIERRSPVRFPLSVVLAYSATGALAFLSITGDLLLDYNDTIRMVDGTFDSPPGILYPVNVLFNALLTGGALFYLAQTVRYLSRNNRSQHHVVYQQLLGLTIGGVLFYVGALWLPLSFWLGSGPLLGVVILYVGLAIVGYAIAHFGLLLEGQNVQRDFIYSLTGIMLLNGLYLGIFSLTGELSVLGAIVTIGLVILTHSAFDQGRVVLDRFFFSPEEQRVRAEARAYATALGTDPVLVSDIALQHRVTDEPDEEPATEADTDVSAAPPESDSADVLPFTARSTIPPDARVPGDFKRLVRKAITNLKSPPQLARSPLLTLSLVTHRLQQERHADNRLNRAAVLRELLLEYIDALRPVDDATGQVSDAWRFYNVLYYPYVREISRKEALNQIRQLEATRQRDGQREPDHLEQVLTWLVAIEDPTFYKWQRKASDVIAISLWEDNNQLHSDSPLAEDAAPRS